MAGENVNRKLNIYINDREVTNSLTGITREMSKVQGQMKSLNKGSEDYDAQLAKLADTYNQLSARQQEFRDDIKGVTHDMDAASNAFQNFWGGLRSGNMKQAQEGLTGLRSGITETTKAAWAFVATPIGATIAALVAVGAGVKALWDYNAGLSEMNNKLSSLGVASEDLAKVRSEVQATADTYEKDFDSIAEKANSLAKAYKISMSEANDYIAQGLATGGQYNDEFLDSLGEYDEFFAKAGYSAKEFIDLVNTGYDLGIYSDKLPDALKEADLAIKEQTKTTKDALVNAFGSAFTEDILKKVRTGEMTTKEALDAIAQKSTEVQLTQQQQAQLTADLFKGAGEDAGGALKIFDAVNTAQKRGLQETTSAWEDLRKANERLNIAQSELFEIEGFADTWTHIKAVGIDAFATFLEGIADFKKDFQPIIDLVGIIFSNTWETVKLAFTSAWEIIDGGFKLLGNGVKTFIEVVKRLFHGDFKGAIAVVSDGFVNMGKIVANVFIGLKNNVLDTLKNIVENTSPVLEALGLDVDKIKKKLESWKSQKFEIKAEVKTSGNNSNNPKEREIVEDVETPEQKAARLAAAKKAAEEKRKLLEQQLKEKEALDKQLLATQRAYQDAQLELMDEGFEKEKAKTKLDFERKIQDLKAQLTTEAELKELQNKIDSAKSSGNTGEANRLKAILDEKLAINKNYNDTIVLLERQRDLKIRTIEEKALFDSFKKEQDAHTRSLNNLKTKHNFELQEINSLEQAKAVLSQTMSEDELKKVKTLADARKLIKEKQLKEEYELEKANLEKLSSMLSGLLELDSKSSIPIFTEEERDKVLQNLEAVQSKIAGLKNPEQAEDNTNKEKNFDNAESTGVDVLGFDAGKWEALFDGLDTFAEKLTAVQMVAGALKQAFSTYFSYLEAAENRQIQKFQKNTDKKKELLAKQLEAGMISQEIYNAKVARAEAELNRKKAEIEYKQAKRKKAMSIVEAVVNTAVAIMQAYSQLGPIGGTVAAVLIGAMGALQIATIAKQPLPDKGGYKAGGFTATGDPNEVDDVVHKGEYVVPNKVLYSNDPMVPQVIDYLEYKRTGKTSPGSRNNSTSETAETSLSSDSKNELYQYLASVIQKNTAVMEKFLSEGVIAWLELDLKTAKKIRQKIQELQTIENSAKR